MGERRLDAALKSFAHRDQVEITYRCFELDPNAEREIETDYYDKLAMKYGMSREQAIQNCKNMEDQAKQVGLDFHFETARLTNTFDAHRLTLYAATKGKMLEMSERLFRAYFTESKHIGDHATLAELAAEVGLDPAEARDVLAGDAFSEKVRADEQEAMNLQVSGVPFYVFNRKYAVSGAQPPEVFQQVLEQVWKEDQPLTILNTDGQVCDETGCRIPDKNE